MSNKSVDEMIDSLTDELQPLKPLAHPLLRVLPFLIGGVFYTWFIVGYIGLRGDFAAKLVELNFLFENAIMMLLGLSSALCASWLCVPDMRGQRWMIPLPFTFGFIFLLWTVLRAYAEGMEWPSMHFDHCMESGLWIAAVPAALMAFLTARGASTQPLLSAAMTVMAVTAFAYIGLRFTCMMDTVGHATVYHLIPFVLLGTLIGVLARRLFKW